MSSSFDPSFNPVNDEANDNDDNDDVNDDEDYNDSNDRLVQFSRKAVSRAMALLGDEEERKRDRAAFLEEAWDDNEPTDEEHRGGL